MTNNTTSPKNTAVIPVEISPEGFGNFSIETQGFSADEIVIAVSSYTKIGSNDHSDDDPAPAQDYWFMVNPMGVIISPGILKFSRDGLSLQLLEIKLSDQNGYYWQESDGATYTILTDSGDFTGISGDLIFNSEADFWMSDSIDISSLADENQSYQVKYHFFNSTHSGSMFSEYFSVEESSSPESSETESTNPTNGLPIPGFMAIIVILSITLLIGTRRKN